MRKRRRPLKTSSIARRKRRRAFIRSFAFLVLCAFFLIGISEGSGVPALSIQSVKVTGNDHISKQEIVHIVDEKLRGQYFHFIAKRNFLLYPKHAVASAILKRYTRIKDVQIKRHGIHLLEVEIIERKALALWCGQYEGGIQSAIIHRSSTFQDVTGTTAQTLHKPAVLPKPANCYGVDKSGFIFAQVEDADRAPQLSVRLYGNIPESGEDPAPATSSPKVRTARALPSKITVVGKHYVNEEDMQTIDVIVKGLKEMSLQPVAIDREAEDDIFVTLTSGINLKMSLEQNAGSTLQNLRDFFKADVFSHEDRHSLLRSFQYIDLRYGNRIFYKEINGSSEVESG